MKSSPLMKRIVSTEFLLLAILTAVLYVNTGFEWWWLFVLFPLFDLSAIGYLKNNHVGALSYNLAHSFIGPAILVLFYITGAPDWTLFVSMIWIFHIFVDRALGYGLKHTDGFNHTHLGKIGKVKRNSKKK